MAGCASSKVSKKDQKSGKIFPEDLSGFGYEFKDGKLRDIDTGGPFQFVVKEGDHSFNQRHYEALGEVITEEVYKLLETECHLEKRMVPFDYDENDPKPHTFIFVSKDAFTNPDKLLVLIHGSGVVRAGQWARRLIINDCLDSGTQIPFIKRAQNEGYGILVMNTNDNRRESRKGSDRIRGSENPESHAAHVWEYYIKDAKAKHIALIAHSYGGCVTTALFQEEKDDFKERVFAVAMTDSVHYISNTRAFKDLVKISCNWVSSTKPLDTPLSSFTSGDIKRVSAGVNVHEQTSWSSFESVFKFLQKRYDAVTKGDGAEADVGIEEGDPAAVLDRKMSIGSDSAIENADVEMTDLTGNVDNLSEEEKESSFEGEKMIAKDATEEGKAPTNETEKEDKSPEGKDDTKGSSSHDDKTAAEGDQSDKSEESEKAVEGEEAPDVEMANDLTGNDYNLLQEEKESTFEGENMIAKDATEEGKTQTKETEKKDKSPEGKDDTKGRSSHDDKTAPERDPNDKSEESVITVEGEEAPVVETTNDNDSKGAHSNPKGAKRTAEGDPENKTEKGNEAPEGEDDTQGCANPDAKTTAEGDKYDNSTKDEVNINAKEDTTDAEMTDVQNRKSAHPKNDNDDEDTQQEKAKKQKGG